MPIHHIFLASENRDLLQYPYGNAYVLHLTNPLKNVTKVELLYCSIPNTIYNLENGTDVITIDQQTFSLPPGFYGGTGFSTELQYALNQTTGLFVNYLTTEGSMMFYRSNTAPFTLTINTKELGELIGMTPFVEHKSSNIAPSPPGTTIIPFGSNNDRYTGFDFVKSDQTVNFNINEGVFLDIDELRCIYNDDANDGRGQSMRRSFGIIALDVPAGNFKRFKQGTDYEYIIEYPVPLFTIDRLSIKFLDRNGKLLNFQGLNDNAMLLRFYCQ
jgi:hypothetical protein